MDMLLKFGIGANSSTFGLLCFATPCYEIGVFQTEVFKMGKIKPGFAEYLGHSEFWNARLFKGEIVNCERNSFE